LKLAVAEGRTYGAETRKRTPRLWSDFVPGIVLGGPSVDTTKTFLVSEVG